MESGGGPADGATAGSWAQAVDTALVDRLHDRARRSGLVRLGQGVALVHRHARMAGGVPLADALTRRVPERAVGPAEMPVVPGRPVPGAAAPVFEAPLPVVRTVG